MKRAPPRDPVHPPVVPVVPVPVPVVPVPKPKSKGRGRGSGAGMPRYEKYPVFSKEGIRVGHLLVNDNAKSIDAHCELHGGQCATGRSYEAYAGGDALTELRASKGRPAAFLVTWLRMGTDYGHGPDGREVHCAIGARGSKFMPACLRDGTSAERCEARDYVETADEMAEVRRVERQPRPGEPLEPPGRL